MPKMPMYKVQAALGRIDDLCATLTGSDMDNMIRGTLKELKVHFLQRNIERAYCTDLDFIVVEFKGGSPRVAALVEVKKHGRGLKDWQRDIYTQIATALNVPFYLLEASENLSNFWITDTEDNATIGPLNMRQFDSWFRSLTDPTIEFYADDRDRSLAEVF